MDMSAAALPPKSGHYTEADRADPDFREYQDHLSSCRRLMIDASDFRNWKFQKEQNAIRDDAAADPLYPAFLAWIRETKAGGRKCPAGDYFPKNFEYWKSGCRW